MVIKVLVLTTNQILVTQLEEIAPLDIGDPNCKMIEPFLLNQDGSLSPWLIDITNENEFMICSDKILTLVDPKPTLLEKYQDLLK
tara:strand:+ start:73 stop:327 length:255 start_codon:yes stop_codon:yes gene_type:complete